MANATPYGYRGEPPVPLRAPQSPRSGNPPAALSHRPSGVYKSGNPTAHASSRHSRPTQCLPNALAPLCRGTRPPLRVRQSSAEGNPPAVLDSPHCLLLTPDSFPVPCSLFTVH
ncbi:hypothetical protein HW132_13680 [Brasilonema sp. CT11]|nr:hypothetical protein [Brasilonema sp. CT11]